MEGANNRNINHRYMPSEPRDESEYESIYTRAGNGSNVRYEVAQNQRES